MARKPRKLDIACPNAECECYNKLNLFNVVKNGYQSNGTPKYKCTECNKTFVRTINTPFFHKHLKKKRIIEICKLLAEKNGYRSISRITGHHLDTVRSIASAIAEHCKKFNEYFITELKLTPIEVDEMWSFVKKKKKTALLRTAKEEKLGTPTPT